jgi:hypothetical protein
MATEKVGMTTADFEAGMLDLDGSAEYKNILVYGGPGSGKTVLSGTVPGRLLILAGEPGYISAARMGAHGKVRLIPDTATATAALRWLEDGGANQFDWVVADGLGTMQNKFLLNYAAEAFDQNPAKRTHRNLPDKPDYFNAQNSVKSWVSGLVDLPCNTLFTTHAMFPEDKETGERLVFPSIQGKGYEVSNYICGLMHAVGYMSPRVVQREEGPVQVRRILWHTVRDPNSETTFFAKDQFNGLGRFTDDLSMPTLLKMMDDGNPEAPAPVPIEAVAAAAPAKKAAAGRRAPVRRR